MSKNKNLKSRSIRRAIAPLKGMSIKDIVQPKTIQEGRENLKRYYGCVDDNLLVLIKNHDRSGNRIKLNEGQRIDGFWTNMKGHRCSDHHPAINKLVSIGDYSFLEINIDMMDGLEDLYEITESGTYKGYYDPSFTMNIIENLDTPLVENDEDYFSDLMKFLRESQDRVNGKYFSDSWIEDTTAYSLFANNDPGLSSLGGFYIYSLENGFNWRWRQMNNSHTRYLHWLLLGPLAPYQYGGSEDKVAA